MGLVENLTVVFPMNGKYGERVREERKHIFEWKNKSSNVTFLSSFRSLEIFQLRLTFSTREINTTKYSHPLNISTVVPMQTEK